MLSSTTTASGTTWWTPGQQGGITAQQTTDSSFILEDDMTQVAQNGFHSPSQPGSFDIRHGDSHCTLQISNEIIIVRGMGQWAHILM